MWQPRAGEKKDHFIIETQNFFSTTKIGETGIRAHFFDTAAPKCKLNMMMRSCLDAMFERKQFILNFTFLQIDCLP